MKKIALTGNFGRGKFALVDDGCFERLNKFKWNLRRGYAVRTVWIDGKFKSEFMHRVINNTPVGMETDHISGIKLDNRKKNLRSCTHTQNVRNRKSSKGYYVERGRIISQIRVNGKHIHLGIFKTKQEASKVYAEAKLKYFGEINI